MYKKLIVVVFMLVLSSCSLFQIRRHNVEQGNLLNPEKIAQVQEGMSEQKVKKIMGTPMLVNIFSPHRLEYVYTFQVGAGKRLQKRVTFVFENNKLVYKKQRENYY